MSDSGLISNIEQNVGIDSDVARVVIDEFLLQLHRGLYEYSGINGDYIVEKLHFQIPPQAFYHLLGFLQLFSEKYDWEAGSNSEVLNHLGGKAEWSPYRHQTEGWVKGGKSVETN
jgi:hypothetical protein